MDPVAVSEERVGDPRAAVARTARMLARMGLVEGFGHVSARADNNTFALTSIDPLCAQTRATILLLGADGRVREGDPAARPLEAPLHTAIYRHRPDVGAICRTHSRHVAAWACRRAVPPIVHGLGGLAGAIAVHGDPDLVSTLEQGEAAAASLAGAACLLLAANGGLSTAPDLSSATVRAWYLEERAEQATLAADAPAFGGEAERRRARHYPAEAQRAWLWLEARFGMDAIR